MEYLNIFKNLHAVSFDSCYLVEPQSGVASTWRPRYQMAHLPCSLLLYTLLAQMVRRCVQILLVYWTNLL